MTGQHNSEHPERRALIIAIAMGACLTFGIIVLSGGDWLPGGIIVVASAVALARELAEIRKLRAGGPPGSPTS